MMKGRVGRRFIIQPSAFIGPGMTAYIALGSNLGDRAATLLSAVRQLNATPGVRVRRLSTFHDTSPVGGPPADALPGKDPPLSRPR